MDRPLKHLGREVARLSLAAMLFLAAFAGARLQGEMGALAARSAGGAAILCSGAVMPVGGDGLPSDARHADCVLCNLPVADAVPAPMLQRVPAVWSAADYRETAIVARDETPLSYTARGPPQLV